MVDAAKGVSKPEGTQQAADSHYVFGSSQRYSSAITVTVTATTTAISSMMSPSGFSGATKDGNFARFGANLFVAHVH